MGCAMKLTICLILICMAASSDGSYRYDYTYFPEVKGWLKLNTIPSSWSDARRKCLLEGGRLASPLDAGLQQAMQALIMNITRPRYMVYTGIHDTLTIGDFLSIEGVPLSKIPIRWAYNEPDKNFDQESCLVMLQDGTVANVNCKDPHPSICYRKLLQNPVLNECGTVDNNYKLDLRTKKCYKFHNIPRTWGQAWKTCIAEGGQLVIVENEMEANVIKELLARNPEHTVTGTPDRTIAMIGYHCWGEHGVWRTIDDRSLDEVFHKFSSGEPNNQGNVQLCGAIYRSGLLDDVGCNVKYSFVCEKSPDSLF